MSSLSPGHLREFGNLKLLIANYSGIIPCHAICSGMGSVHRVIHYMHVFR